MQILYHLHNWPLSSFILNEIRKLERRGHEMAVYSMNDQLEYVVHDGLNDIYPDSYFTEQPSFSDIRGLLSTNILHSNILRKAFLLRQHF